MPVTGKPIKYSKYLLRAIFHIKESMTRVQKKILFRRFKLLQLQAVKGRNFIQELIHDSRKKIGPISCETRRIR